jgi:hypothetical protein
MLYISTQILAEFYSTITSSKRATNPYAPMEAIEFERSRATGYQG